MKKIKNMLEDWQKAGMLTKDLFKGENLAIEDIDDKKSTILFVVSDETVDRVGERMIASGCNLENYNKTGKPVLWCHNRKEDNPPIGRGIWAKLIDNKIKVLTEFYADKGNAWSDFAKLIFEMYRDDWMQCVSIGFIPNKRREPTEEEIKLFPTLQLITETWEMLEHSPVPIGANPNATQEKIIQEKLLEVREAMEDKRIIIPSVCLEDFGFKEEEKSMIESTEIEIDEIEIKPYPNEHSCRLNLPDKYDRFARKNCEQKHEGKCIDVIYGVKDNKSEIQALRYSTDIWTASAARSHCKSREGSFEAASGKEIDFEKISVYDIDGNEIGFAKIPKTEIVKQEKDIIKIVEPVIRLKDSKENPENPEERDSISLTEKQIEDINKDICLTCQKEIADSVLRGFRKKLGIVDVDET
jgi:hypothetical protein